MKKMTRNKKNIIEFTIMIIVIDMILKEKMLIYYNTARRNILKILYNYLSLFLIKNQSALFCLVQLTFSLI